MSTQTEDHGQHISQQFNAALEEVKTHMLEMGGAVEKQLSEAIEVVLNSDSGLGQRVIKEDDEIDAMERNIDEECSLIIARRQPAASDLRLVLAIIKTIRDLERIGDESSKIARMGVKLSESGDVAEGFVEFRYLSEKVRSLVNRALDSFARFDVEAALAVAQEDAEVDKYYASAIRSLITYMAEDPAQISRMLNLLWAFRALERVGDHAKNVSEHVIYLVRGTDIRHENLTEIAEQLVD